MIRRPVQTLVLDMSSTNIVTSGWTAVITSLSLGASAIEVFCPSGSPVMISQGTAGHETEALNLLPMTILPGGTAGPVAVELGGGKPITLKAIGTNIAAGYLIINLYA